MTDITEAYEAIYGQFITAWADRTPYTFANEKFKIGDVSAWARLSIRHEESGQETLGPPGNRKFARPGRVILQLFNEENVGVGPANTLLMVARNAFEGVTLAGTTVRFNAVTVREAGAPDEDDWYMSIMDAPFEYDETR